MDCQSGCTVPREHLATCTSACSCACHTGGAYRPECDTPGGCGSTHPDTKACRGCLPRQTEDDEEVCRGCKGRTHDALVRVADLVAHIREHVEPGAGGGDGVHVRGTRTPPAPLSLAAVDDADALHAMLAAWCVEVMDGRDLSGPNWHGTLVLPASRRTRAPGRHGRTCRRCICFHDARPVPAGPHLPTCTGATCDGCGIAYDSARAFGLTGVVHDGRNATTSLVTWLRPHLAWVYVQPWAAEFVAEITSTVTVIGERWPTEDRPVRCAAPCPACDRLTLVRYTPRFFTEAISIRCTAPDCRQPLDEKLYGHYVRVLTDQVGGAA